MRKLLFTAVILTSIIRASFAADAASGPPPKGTICYGTNGLRMADTQPISCKELGRFSSVAEIYERGYRVVSSGVLPEPGGTIFLIIEQRT